MANNEKGLSGRDEVIWGAESGPNKKEKKSTTSTGELAEAACFGAEAKQRFEYLEVERRLVEMQRVQLERQHREEIEALGQRYEARKALLEQEWAEKISEFEKESREVLEAIDAHEQMDASGKGGEEEEEELAMDEAAQKRTMWLEMRSLPVSGVFEPLPFFDVFFGLPTSRGAEILVSMLRRLAEQISGMSASAARGVVVPSVLHHFGWILRRCTAAQPAELICGVVAKVFGEDGEEEEEGEEEKGFDEGDGSSKRGDEKVLVVADEMYCASKKEEQSSHYSDTHVQHSALQEHWPVPLSVYRTLGRSLLLLIRTHAGGCSEEGRCEDGREEERKDEGDEPTSQPSSSSLNMYEALIALDALLSAKIGVGKEDKKQAEGQGLWSGVSVFAWDGLYETVLPLVLHREEDVSWLALRMVYDWADRQKRRLELVTTADIAEWSDEEVVEGEEEGGEEEEEEKQRRTCESSKETAFSTASTCSDTACGTDESSGKTTTIQSSASLSAASCPSAIHAQQEVECENLFSHSTTAENELSRGCDARRRDCCGREKRAGRAERQRRGHCHLPFVVAAGGVDVLMEHFERAEDKTEKTCAGCVVCLLFDELPLPRSCTRIVWHLCSQLDGSGKNRKDEAEEAEEEGSRTSTLCEILDALCYVCGAAENHVYLLKSGVHVACAALMAHRSAFVASLALKVLGVLFVRGGERTRRCVCCAVERKKLVEIVRSSTEGFLATDARRLLTLLDLHMQTRLGRSR
ncbi:uncharacterized protein MONOS_13113 [Monocercomonoides exilis]|uniref:uncharacterized protein n=1 Tax=Monocercomonoides exilis TaxID=2049356 RepID=UPI00355A2E33|nr:hypothetical protein MONOS_13113 [Monocercomonoides exilis]|eukprot:MONOS_13113.1-p1 / transcript=MONOS_13113.1 / gene=MONOS_13113 / organism=Monocercomonoides_exilis_PA203 / gene_product=unspecified product / transcript_product=unspecified product / location=Mono_scaffold00779:17306-20022(-) / protein_length=751 / sequence_SO=supercontig / SO=protein_coding / is_pseudo=false